MIDDDAQALKAAARMLTPILEAAVHAEADADGEEQAKQGDLFPGFCSG